MPIEPPKDGAYFDPAHPTTKAIYNANKMDYPKTSDDKALELKMDKIRTYDGKYDFKRSVVRLCRFQGEDGNEYLDTEEWITGKSSIGNPQEYYSRDKNYSHGEPDINKIATLANGEQIIVTGDYIKHVKRAFELPWQDFKDNKDGIYDQIMNNIKDGNKNKLVLRVESPNMPRSYGEFYPKWWDVWFNYSWEDLVMYCETGVKKDDIDSLSKYISKLSPDKRKAVLNQVSQQTK